MAGWTGLRPARTIPAVLASIHSFVLIGIDAVLCHVEVNVEQTGLASSTIVGLPQTAVKESVERVKQSIDNSGYPFKGKRLLVNLAPADVKKDAPSLDLPIALGMLKADGFIKGEKIKRYLVAGELALDGRLRKIKGGLALSMLAKEKKYEGVIVPPDNAQEASVVDGVTVIAAHTLQQAVSFLNDTLDIEPFVMDESQASSSAHLPDLDFADVRGQEAVKRAITIAAAGSHNILMLGPPGTGKTMLANRIPGIMPPLSRAESLETTRIYSSLGLLPDGVALIDQRPVRSPHHSATAQALIGGGSVPKPGEVSLAHHGVLFLDELPEFSRYVLEMLRQPLENGEVTIARVHATVRFPARFMLVAALNPTAKGTGSARASAGGRRDRYLDKLSQPLLDRIDMHIEVPTVPYHELISTKPGTSTPTMRRWVEKSREIQKHRNGPDVLNAHLSGKVLAKTCKLDDDCLHLMKQAMEELGLSARAYDKVRRVARTIADLEGKPDITPNHLAEAIQYRLLDRTH